MTCDVDPDPLGSALWEASLIRIQEVKIAEKVPKKCRKQSGRVRFFWPLAYGWKGK